MSPTAALVMILQVLDASPAVGEVGKETVVMAREEGRPLPGLEVFLLDPAGGRRPLGRTDAAGILRWRPRTAGAFELHARLPAGGPLLVLPYYAASRPRRWLWALVCVPAGLALLWANLRRRPAVSA